MHNARLPPDEPSHGPRRPKVANYSGFPHSAVLLTGTGIVPDDDFTLQDGDEVAIEIEPIGTLCTTVRQMQQGG